jgi:hypothetical protein
MSKLIESNTSAGQYGMTTTEAVIDHPEHGRLYIAEGYGGEQSPAGGAYRWRHGIVCKLQAGDTLESLKAEHNDNYTIRDAMRGGYRDDRPALEWTGDAVQRVAESVGL